VVLELGLRSRVALERGFVARARRHLRFQSRESRLDRKLCSATGQQVLLDRTRAITRWSLIVERDAHTFREAELAAVKRLLAREHPQQRRLAGSVATGDRHPLARLELERDAAEQRYSGDVLREVGGNADGHVSDGMQRRFAPIRCARCGA
jgi:hypothetical protein